MIGEKDTESTGGRKKYEVQMPFWIVTTLNIKPGNPCKSLHHPLSIMIGAIPCSLPHHAPVAVAILHC